MRQLIKNHLLRSGIGTEAYAKAQELWFDWTYRRRRERYQATAAASKSAFSPTWMINEARRRLASRGYSTRRSIGDIHTFAFIPANWPHQEHIARALERLGPTTRFDYTSKGWALQNLRDRFSGANAQKEMLRAMLEDLREANRRRPVDWFFSYAIGWDMTASTIAELQSELGVPAVNVSLDDKNWWDEIERGDARGGLRGIARAYDLSWTSAQVVLPWYWAEGGRAVFLPEGVDTSWFRPLDVEQDVDVGFVGSNFGRRERQIELLRRAGLNVIVRGFRWSDGPLDDEEMLRFFSRCKVNLGFGDMHYSRWLTNLKGRDFEIPSTGRGVYITTYNSDLARCFDLGAEIRCYRGMDEAVEIIRAHLRRHEESQEIALRGRKRCVREHRWEHRMMAILYSLGILAELPEEAEASIRLMGTGDEIGAVGAPDAVSLDNPPLQTTAT
jgi:hypothetical protein